MCQESSARTLPLACVVCAYAASDQPSHFVRFGRPGATLCKWCLDAYCAHRDALRREAPPPDRYRRWETLLTPLHVPPHHVYPFRS